MGGSLQTIANSSGLVRLEPKAPTIHTGKRTMTNEIQVQDSSEDEIMREVFKLCDAGGSVIQIRTREIVRAAGALRRGILAEDSIYSHYEWDIVNGFRNFTLENHTNGLTSGSDIKDFVAALERPMEELRNAASAICTQADKVHCFVYVDVLPYIQGNPYVITLLQQYAAILPSRNVCLIFITPEQPINDLPLGTVLVADMPTPNADELKDALSRIIQNVDAADWEGEPEIDDEELEQIAHLGLGMSRYEFETHAALAIVEASQNGEDIITADILTAGIAKGKTEVIKQSDILELFHAESMKDVGGMQRLKDWVADRANNFSDEAKKFGIEPPKGVAIVGVPGAGKSQIAKAIAGAWGVPLIRLDFGSVFSKYIGDSESRMRAALNMVSRMGRLVLFADEIDKGLGGIGSGGDSGVSTRVLGTFLTWMQENKSDVFVIMTANRIEGLPPELFRRGRLDAVFSVGLPTDDERVEVLEVHLRKRGRTLKQFKDAELKVFKEFSQGYLPAEIESAVKDALVIAYNDEGAEDLTLEHLRQAFHGMVPMSISHKEQIDRILAWAEKNATPVNYPQGKPGTVVPLDTSKRRTTARRSRPTEPKLH